MQDINLQVADAKHWSKHDGIVVVPPHERQDACDELLRGERYRENIVYPPLEGRQLGFQVAPSRKCDDGETSALRCRAGEALQQPTPGDVHVQDEEVRTPICKRE